MRLQSLEDAAGARKRSPGGLVRRGLGIGIVVWFVGFVLSFLVTPLVAGPIPIAAAPVTGPILSYLGFHLWFLLSTGDLVLGYGTGLILASIPFAAMLAGGTAAATGPRGSGLQAGASIAVGYGLATLVAYGVVVVLVDTGISPLTLSFGSGPGTLVVLVVNGVVQPALVGAVGGWIAG